MLTNNLRFDVTVMRSNGFVYSYTTCADSYESAAEDVRIQADAVSVTIELRRESFDETQAISVRELS